MDRDTGFGCNWGMSEPLIAQTLMPKRPEILGQLKVRTAVQKSVAVAAG